MIRARMVRDILELQEWCKDYMASPRCTTHDPLRRFAIGIYQIYQGIKWGENASGSESLAAAAIHFCMAGELANASVESSHTLSKEDSEFKHVKCSIDYPGILIHISRAQQMIVYYTNNVDPRRCARFSEKILADNLATLIALMIRPIDRDRRVDSLYIAMEVMCGE